MFVKYSWNPRRQNRSVQAHIAESYRDPERHRLLLNISWLPAHVIEAIAQSLGTAERC